MPCFDPLNRRHFFGQSLSAAAAAGLAASALPAHAQAPREDRPAAPGDPEATLPLGTIGKVKLSRMLLGGNLISGYMHSRDLKYVNTLFRAYATEEKILETLGVAEQNGINTVFESGAQYIHKYNDQCGGHMQFIPHIEVSTGQTEQALKDHIQQQVDTGAVALYVWGVSSDTVVRDGEPHLIHRGVELAKKHGLPVGVGCHSLQVPIACEQIGVPCDFYVKTLHSDDYPSATPKEKRQEFVWLDGGEGWYDNMWCLNPEETIAFMQEVKKPWIAFKVLAAGAIAPLQAFPWAFKNGADFIAVGMLDFQIKSNCEVARKAVQRSRERTRPWFA